MNIINNGLKILMIFLLKKWSRKTHLSIFRSIFCQVCLYRSWSRNTRSGGTLGNFPGTSPTSRCRHPTYSSGSLLCRRSRSDSGWEKKVPNPACLAIVQIKSNSQEKAALVNSSDNSTQKQQKFLIAFSLK